MDERTKNGRTDGDGMHHHPRFAFNLENCGMDGGKREAGNASPRDAMRWHGGERFPPERPAAAPPPPPPIALRCPVRTAVLSSSSWADGGRQRKRTERGQNRKLGEPFGSAAALDWAALRCVALPALPACPVAPSPPSILPAAPRHYASHPIPSPPHPIPSSMAGWLAGSQGSWTNPAGAGSINPTQAAAAAAGSERANEEAGAVVGDGLPACGGLSLIHI